MTLVVGLVVPTTVLHCLTSAQKYCWLYLYALGAKLTLYCLGRQEDFSGKAVTFLIIKVASIFL